MNALLVTLRLEDPVLLAGVGNGEENSRRTIPYIPGVALRGAIASRYVRKHKPADLPTDKTAGRLFFSNKVCYLNAYPTSGTQGSRSLPLPVSWRKKKIDNLEDAKFLDFALRRNSDWTERVGKAFCGSEQNDNEKFVVLNPYEELAIHIASQERGVVSQDNSTVFQYQALARGQQFVAVIVANEAQDLKTLQTLLKKDHELFLGRSRAAGYGRVRVENIRQQQGWQEVEVGHLEDVTTITLLSDTLLRDQYGQPTHDLDGYLSHRLKKQLVSKHSFIQTSVVGGFNRKWELPLPQFMSLGMGSVFVYAAGDLSPDELTTFTRWGIGERRIDGFGRLAINWPGEEEFQVEEIEPAKPVAIKSLSKGSQKLALTMSERLLRQRLEGQLVAESQKYTIRGNINNHQLSRLRSVLRNTINQQPDVQPVQAFFDDLNLKPTSKKQFERSRIHRSDQKTGPRVITWIQARLSENDGLTELGFNDTLLSEVAGQKPMITEQLKTEYTLRLIEAVTDRKMKQNRKRGM